MSSSSEGKGTLREWANSKKPLWLYSFGTIPYVREGAEVRIAPVGSTDRIVVEVLGAVPGLEPVKPSFNIAGAEFAQFAPDDIPADVPFSLDDIKGYKLFLWVITQRASGADDATIQKAIADQRALSAR
jgi:hypothetical protein